MKNFGKKKILFGLIVLILMSTIIACLFTTSNGYTEYQNGQRWYYEVVDEEAVNVRIVNFDAETTEITVPETLGGYPVTSISGFDGQMPFSNSEGIVWYYSNVGAFYNMFNVTGKDFYGHPIDIKVRKVTLPNTIKTIGRNAFWNCRYLEEINIPSSLENIERYAFEYTNIKELELDGVKIGYGVFDASSIEKLTIKNTILDQNMVNIAGNLKDVVIGEGVTEITRFGTIPADCNVQIGSDLQKISRYAFRNVTDVYVNNYKANVELEENAQAVERFNYAYIHFLDGETISTSTIDGVKIINTDTNEEVNEINVETGSDFSFKLEQDAEHNYQNHIVYIETDNTYYGKTKEVEKIELPFGETYTIENVMRNKKIYIQERESGLDLNLRQYISKVNGVNPTIVREPRVEKQANGTVKYLHTKNTIYPLKGDKITYGIRVYNEGTVAGKATKITEFIPAGLKFDEASGLNFAYNWQISNDGRTATTTCLAEETINPYTIYNVDYKEIFIDLIVDVEQTETASRLVNLAEITEATGTDIDSIPGNITEGVDETYLKEESENSTEDSYIQGTEDDNDFENIVRSDNTIIPYSLKINKIDGIDYELLNGATFELLNADKNLIKTGVTANNGELDFGVVNALGEGKTTYYVRETYTPTGYKNHLKYLIQVDIINTSDENTGLSTKIELDIEDIDIDTSKYKTIEISSKADLMAIESNKEEKYVLTQDIDLEEDWMPLNVQNVKIDGQGHKITGLKLSGNDETIKTWGLFSTYSGIIENLTLEGVNINITKFDTEESTDLVDGVGGFIGYSDGVILKNCKVTGAIGDSLRNIGGLVGHTKAGSIIVTRNCTNEATIHFTNSSNAGGIVGCALGPVKSYNDVNKGYIVGSAYNIGGIVGYARQEGYERIQIFANYDETNNLIKVAVKNEEIDGKYQFKISKTDEFGNKLNGAKFQILDRDKQVIPGYESVEATDGIINYEETRISCIGNDVYYIKEVEAPEGYLPIEDNYIKVVVNKKWDREEEKYYTETTYKVLSNEEFATEVSEDYNTSNTKSGQTYTKVDANVQWNINEVDIENATNDYSIVGVDQNRTTIVGGILGNSKGRALICGSVNKKEITSSCSIPRAAGIVGTIEKNLATDEASIIDCKNEAKINSFINNSSNYNKDGNTSGILAYSRIDIKIDGCDNNGEISSNTVGSGILGSGVGNIEISNCNNIAKISGPKTSAGIFAENFYINGSAVDNGNTIIDNCTNSGNITGGDGHGSGIYGVGDPYDFTVTNCSVSGNITITGKDASGIAVMPSSENVTIENCKVEGIDNETQKVIINSTDNHGSGILAVAMFDSYINLSPEQRGRERKNDIVIKNCEVNNATISGGSAAGIESHGGWGNRTISHNISGCYVKNTIINARNTGSIGGEHHAGGIFGSGYALKNINIDSCVVEDSEVNGGYTTSGIMACSGYNGSLQNLYVKLNNCQVIGTKVQSSANAGGILGDSNYDARDNSYRGSLEVTNANVYDCEIIGGTNTAGVLNVGMSASQFTGIANDCVVEKTTITGGSDTNGNTSGIAGALSTHNDKDYTFEFNRCKVIDCDISSSGTAQTTGLVGFNFGKTNIYDCEVSETSVICGSSSGKVVTGLLGMTWSSNEIKRCSVKNCQISGTGTNVGGMYSGYSMGSTIFEDCITENTSIISKTTTDGNATTGGICAGGGDTDTFINCTVKNSTISSKNGTTGGMIGAAYKASFDGCKIQNTNISNESTDTSYNATGGLLGAAQLYGEVSLNNCSVTDNCEITAKGYSTGGMIGYTNKINNLKNCTAQDLTITAGASSRDSSNQTKGSVGGIIGDANGAFEGDIEEITVKNVSLSTTSDNVGGIIAINLSYGTKKIKDCDIENLTIESTNTYGTSNGRLIAGLMGMTYCDIELENTTVKNVDIEVQSGYTNNISVGGLFAYLSRNFVINEDSVISDIDIVNGTNGKTGGMVSKLSAYDVKGINISNLKNYNNISVVSNNYAGAISGLESGKIDIDGLSGKNITVQGKVEVGGLIGVTSLSQTANISNINLEDLAVTGERKVGGILGNVIGTAETSLDNITINNLNVSNAYTQIQNYMHTGGLIGYALKPTLNDITINGLNVSSSVPGYNSSGSAMGICTGGLVGITAPYSSYGTTTTETPIAKFSNITISNAEDSDTNNIITSKSQYTGGLIGYTDNLETSGQISIGNTNISRTKTETEINNPLYYDDAGDVGGIAGFANNYSSAQNITLSNVEITGAKDVGGIVGESGTLTLVKDNTLNNVKVTGVVHVGGIAGNIFNTGTEFKDLTINNLDIDEIQGIYPNLDGYSGGLVAVIPKATVSNITADGININNHKGFIGGLIGIVHNYYATGSITDNTYISDSTLKNVTITTQGGSARTGGLIGFVTHPVISNVEIQNIDISITDGNSTVAGGMIGIVAKAGPLTSDTTVEAVAEFTDITVSATGTNTNSISVANGIAGGLVGYADKIQTTGDIEVSNMNLTQGGNSSNYPGVGGIVGTVQKYPTISNITLNNIEMSGTKYAGGITGVVYQETSNISDITLNNVKVSATNLESGYVESQTGGLIGVIASANIQDITANGIEVTNGKGQAGGLIGTVTNSYINNGNIAVSDIVNVKDSTLKNIKVSGTRAGSNTVNVGGLIGVARTPIISNVTLTNIDVDALTSSNASAGGLVAIINSGSAPAQFSDITINTEGTTRNNVTGVYYGNMLAGVGQLSTSNINISNIDVTGKVAGAIGVAAAGSTVSGITINNANVTGLSGGQFTAGIAAEASGSSVESCTISNSSITTTSTGWTGGIVGLYSADALGVNGKILSCNANNVNITATGGSNAGIIAGVTNSTIEESNVTGGSITTTSVSQVGGIVGIAGSTTGEIKNCNVTNNTLIRSTTAGATLGGIAGVTNKTISGSTVSSATIENAGSIIGGIAGYMSLTSSSLLPENYKIDNCNVENSTLTSTGRNTYGNEYVGGIAGISNSIVMNSNVTGSTITAECSNVGGIAGMLSNNNSTVATSVKLSNCTVTSTTIEGKTNHVGGIAGFANNAIEDSTITDSEVKGTGDSSSGIGGILGHGSNVTGIDANIYNSKVICTNVTGVNQVGGISGGAVNTIEDCYVGGKENVTYTQDEPAVTITGNDSVGGIIGDAGIITADNQVMITLNNNTIQDTKIERNARAKLTGESDDEHKMIGTHNSFGTTIVNDEEVPYTGTQAETIAGNTVTNVTLNERTE